MNGRHVLNTGNWASKLLQFLLHRESRPEAEVQHLPKLIVKITGFAVGAAPNIVG
jgi:hypothetical protein